MKEVKNMDLSKLGMKEDLEFHKQVYAIVEQANDLDFRQHVFAYREKIIAYDETLQLRQRTAITKEVSHLDKRRDRAYSALNALVSVGLMHFNTGIAEKSRQIQLVLHNYGNPIRLPYQEESTVISQLTEVLNTKKYRERLASIHADEWLDELIEANHAFNEAYLQRKKKQISLVTSETTLARKEADQMYYSLMKVTNALLHLYQNTEKDRFGEELNHLIEQTIKSPSVRRKQVKVTNIPINR